MLYYKPILKYISLIFLGIFVGLILTESLTRIYQDLSEKQIFGLTPARTTITWQDHPIIGKVLLTANIKGWFVTPSKEYYNYIQANSQGFYDVEHQFKKPVNTFRILFLGDSFVASLQTPLQLTFFKQVEKSLNQQNLDKKIEVIAMGLGDTGTAQQLLALKEIGLKYKPDLVIQMFFTANDLKNNCPNLQKDPYRPYFTASQRGELILQPHLKYSKRESSSIKDQTKKIRLVEMFLQSRQKFLEYKANTAGDYPIDYHVYDSKYNQDYQKAWDITQKLILETKKLVEKSGGKYILVTLANNEQVNNLVWEELKNTYPNLATAHLDLEKPDKMIMQFCLENYITCFQLLPEFQKFANNNPNTPTHYQLDGHWNQIGTNIVAEYLFNQLQAILP